MRRCTRRHHEDSHGMTAPCAFADLPSATSLSPDHSTEQTDRTLAHASSWLFSPTVLQRTPPRQRCDVSYPVVFNAVTGVYRIIDGLSCEAVLCAHLTIVSCWQRKSVMPIDRHIGQHLFSTNQRLRKQPQIKRKNTSRASVQDNTDGMLGTEKNRLHKNR